MTSELKTVTKFAFAIVNQEKLGNLRFLEEKPANVIITDDDAIDMSLREFMNSAAFYTFKNAQDLLNVCSYHDWVWFNQRTKVKGKDVTYDDAVKLFEKYAKTRDEHNALSSSQEDRRYKQYIQDEYPFLSEG